MKKKMNARFWTKKQCNQTKKECMQAGFNIVTKGDFTEIFDEETLVVSWLPFNNAWMVRVNLTYF